MFLNGDVISLHTPTFLLGSGETIFKENVLILCLVLENSFFLVNAWY